MNIEFATCASQANPTKPSKDNGGNHSHSCSCSDDYSYSDD